MDNILLLSVLLVFAAALIGSLVQRRRRDRVLVDLHGFHVTAQMKDGSTVWGRLKVYPSGVEFVYTRPFKNHRGNLGTSYILFKDSIDKVQQLYRFHDELSPENQLRRQKEVRQTSENTLPRRGMRSLRNFINTFRDAINESLGLFLTRMKGISSSILAQQHARIQTIGAKAVGMVGNAYDPILENYVGRRVVIELEPENKEKQEFAGVLREYSPLWMSLFDCEFTLETRLPLNDLQRLRELQALDFGIHVESSDIAKAGIRLKLNMTNRSTHLISFQEIKSDLYRHRINAVLEAGESGEWLLDDLPEDLVKDIAGQDLPLSLSLLSTGADIELDNGIDDIASLLPDLTLVFESVREVDVFAPRAIASLRHGAEYIGKW